MVLGILRPNNHTGARGCWNSLHHSLGRFTVIVGMGNCVLGALLIHNYKGDSYLFWLLPACVLVGLAGITALTLEAFKMQVRQMGRRGIRAMEASEQAGLMRS